MSFGGGTPAPMVVPPTPVPAPELTPVAQKPKRKPSQPTVVGGEVGPTAQQTQQSERTLLGGAPSTLGG